MAISSAYDASSSMLGYLYQCRQALLLAIQQTKSAPSRAITIERFDDVAFHDDVAPNEQIQLKHHVNPGNLTDASADLWKTIRIWSEQVKADDLLPLRMTFKILTTSTAAEGSIAAKLRPERNKPVDEATALKSLREVATQSTNQETKAGREAFLALSPTAQGNLVSAIEIHDQAPSITNSKAEIEQELIFSAPHGKVSSLVDHLEGWWLSQVVNALSKASSPPIELTTLRAKIDEIGAAFRAEELLINPEALVVPDASLAENDGRIFVQQLRCVALPPEAIDLAKRDFYRATAQRSAWARESLLLDGEARRYDEGLVERWKRERMAMEADGALTSDEDKATFGQKLFHWANRHQAPFRNRHEGWLTTGSYQILADAVSVGWHPDHATMFQTEQDEAA